MNYEIDGAFAKSEQILPFLNDVFIICFITVNIMFVFTTRLCFKTEQENYKALFKFYRLYKIYFIVLFLCVIFSDYILSQSGDFKFSDPMILATINTKFVIYLFVLCNFIYISSKINIARKFYQENNIEETKENLIIASHYFGVLNIALLFFIIYLKVVIGEFK
ncbi:putative membrane protein [Campylobacter blaseri]|uniref:3-isopropylmalate dehydratase n=1 Tax=Campylobacter blaseri TaxID=2042961 RepID=A0A2P8R070_9BACT|nr:hypothetical protein [Campylobacter blaseri]PSM51888.1 hypothetical protein CQ405_04800 [Campylobacter blaseri]PSM53672.1 hypothetical protein CRN67_04800 [Campylobacter blaseri]QKF85775.1 putative membrane protein [Campylobacter blaseri]